jgi:intracellular sulfur oxidation DsrE/DsrF family protein
MHGSYGRPRFDKTEVPEMQNQEPLRVLIHAPTAGAVTRARNNAVNLLVAAPESEVRILVNAEGVAALLDSPRPETDVLTLVCANTLKRLGPPSTRHWRPSRHRS